MGSKVFQIGHYFPKGGQLIGLNCIRYFQSKKDTRNTPMITYLHQLLTIIITTLSGIVAHFAG